MPSTRDIRLAHEGPPEKAISEGLAGELKARVTEFKPAYH